MEAYSNPEKVLADALSYLDKGKQLFEQKNYPQSCAMFDYAVRTFRKLNMKDAVNSAVLDEKTKMNYEAQGHLGMAQAAVCGSNPNAFSALKASTYCLELQPENVEALVARIRAFVLPGIWQSRKRCLADLKAIRNIQPDHPFLEEFEGIELPSATSDDSFGVDTSKRVVLSDDPEILEAQQYQALIRDQMIKSFSSNLHLLD